MFLHRDETLNVASADDTRLFGFDEALAAVAAHTQVTARHNHCVFVRIHAHHALLVAVVLHVELFLAFDRLVLVRHPVNCLDFVGQSIDEHCLFEHSHARHVLISVQHERAVADHGERLVTLLVVNRNNQREVAARRFGQLEPHNEVKVEID